MSDPITPAAPVSEATATEPTATAPAPAVEASHEAPRKVGFFAKILGLESRIGEIQGHLATEQAAHAATRGELVTAQARIAEFEALEASLDADLASARAEATAATAAAQIATTAAATVPQQVAAGVADAVASLGVPEATLAPVTAELPAKGTENAHLTGRERAAAAFNAQFATA